MRSLKALALLAALATAVLLILTRAGLIVWIDVPLFAKKEASLYASIPYPVPQVVSVEAKATPLPVELNPLLPDRSTLIGSVVVRRAKFHFNFRAPEQGDGYLVEWSERGNAVRVAKVEALRFRKLPGNLGSVRARMREQDAILDLSFRAYDCVAVFNQDGSDQVSLRLMLTPTRAAARR